MLRDKITKWLVYISGIICLYLFLAIRIEPLYNIILKEKIIPEYWENVKYGELYYYNNFIKQFRENNLPPSKIKYRYTKKHPKPKDADILTFGDSFFDFSRMTTFPERLADTLQKKVFYERFIDDHRPVIFLKNYNYSNTNPKVLLYESSERFIPFRFLTKHDSVPYIDKRSKFRKSIASARDWLFLKERELKLSVLLDRSIFTTDIYSAIATFKFDAFGYITESTPKYSLKYDSPWLFYQDEVNKENSSFYYSFTDEEIETICNNIASLADQLKRYYNLEMVFLPIPSKYVIYHRLLNNDTYSNFLPRLYEGLEKRGVPVVKLYDLYLNSDEILYYGTDNHWNKKGLDIALDETLKILSEKKLFELNDSSTLLTENKENNKLHNNINTIN